MAAQNAHAEVLTEVYEEEKPKKVETEWFDLQPIEKKLCAYSLGLGLGLLAVFILLFEVF
ncbi:hypothetical protein [Anaeroarcus burkinensis]|uniref:hypothetical protein n=1 Tax=Anaeroarcus burkinensis TaxID=82376 RepID=UPI00040AECC4|nr:hypothetical protein [Anaeroarcus burkinensis]